MADLGNVGAERRRHGELELTGFDGGRGGRARVKRGSTPFIGKGGGGEWSGDAARHLGKAGFASGRRTASAGVNGDGGSSAVASGRRGARPTGPGCVACVLEARWNGQE